MQYKAHYAALISKIETTVSKMERVGSQVFCAIYFLTLKQINMERKIPNFSISELKEFSFIFKSEQGFLWRLWFLVSAPVLWLIKGEVKIK